MAKEDKNIATATQDIVSAVPKALKKMSVQVLNGIGPVGTKLIELGNYMQKLVEPFSKVQDAVSELTKATGLASQGVMNLTKRMIAQNREMSLSMSYGMSNEQMIKLQEQLMTSIGRNVQIDMAGTAIEGNPNFDSEIENLVAAAQVFGPGEMAQMVAGFDKVGISMKGAAKASGKLFAEAGKYGVNLQKYSQNVVNNLDMVQRFTFRKGVDGLKEMARKATEVRQNMAQVSAFAEKVGTVEGAIEAGARLQVLGGSFTQLANPLSMLNESLTNMEGLQDRLLQMTKGAAHYDQTTKQVEMDPLTKLRIKAAAESMGVDANNLLDQAFAQGRREEIGRQMQGYGGFSNEFAELLKNVGEIDSETGVAGATINGRFETLSNIANDPELQKKLVEETRSESEDIKVIAKEVMTMRQMLEGRKYQVENQAASNKLAEGVFQGQSVVEAVEATVTRAFDDKLIEAAGRIDRTVETALITPIQALLNDMAEGVKPFRLDSIEQFNEEFGTAIKNVIGEGPIQEAFTGVVASAATMFDKFSSSVNQFTDSVAGINFRINSQIEGTQGGAPLTAPPLAGADVAQAAVDNANQAAYQPRYRRGDLEPLVVSNGGFAPQAVIMTANEKTLAGMPVSQPQSQVAQETAPRNLNPGEVNVNLNGNLTMTVYGDNGKIGEVDLVKLLENNQNFRNELARIIEEAVKSQQSSGLINN